MLVKNLSLRIRLFLAMIILVIIASILIVIVAINQYKEQGRDYNEGRLNRKGNAIKKNVDYVLNKTTYEVSTKKLPAIFKEKINELSEIHGLPLNIYNLNGEILISSKGFFSSKNKPQRLADSILLKLENTANKKVIYKTRYKDHTRHAVYLQLTDEKFKPIGILNIPYIEDNSFNKKELNEFLERLAVAYFFVLLIGISLAYFLSQYITKKIKEISEKIKETRLNKNNQRIDIKDASEEISTLVEAYNSMIDELEESAQKLAQTEREHAWREMAKQVAHEIKNPLTPMRLSIQNFQRKFDPSKENIKAELNEFSNMLITQIDTMSTIASAFSDFAKMPSQNKERINITENIKHTIDLFGKPYISYFHEETIIYANVDKTQLTRVVTNLIKNASQALEEQSNPKIEVHLIDNGTHFIIKIADNGIGIPEHLKDKIFEPKFTTKSSGMGLGLPMIKKIIESYKGTISYTSTVGRGTVFTVTIPKK